ncbi:MAG TPA: CDP-glycerol--poly(glycerophosphate) glycerophosphotransferase [Lachnospiraceae bacterium]|jgi:CDP-glycerol glycerophosphotransferase|nr:CDP-glycerol--poly(glycerophosphate) glycerophosphotransferase [Lachnospiraceae bacterium]HCX41063.1 CDP-glycerol--poly(glycerophosphate) glycerophosphotransferase [Lachnospiraceae bacterium]
MTIRSWAKTIIAYTIEGEYKVYRIRKTSLQIRILYTRKYHKLYDHEKICPNKIVFDNYMGNGYGCNPKYVLKCILEMPQERTEGLDLVWITKTPELLRPILPARVRIVLYDSEQAFYEYATAKLWVKNFQMVHLLNQGLLKKKEQIYIQMWHGSFGIKKIEGDCGYLNADKAWLALAKKNAAYTDFWISNSRFESDVYKNAFWGAGKILEYGHPRNDLFFEQDQLQYKRKVQETYGIAPEKKLFFYMPTFRDQDHGLLQPLPYERIAEELGSRFGGEWVCLVRLHPRRVSPKQIEALKEQSVMDATMYPDVQELLAAADAMVTDYSSAIFDFLLTKRPGFILAEDYDAYEQIRGFYYPLTDTPFPLAKTNEELLEQIGTFDEESYRQKIDAFLKEKGSVEDGNASKRVAELILTQAGKR